LCSAWRRQTALTAVLLLGVTLLVSRIRAAFFPLYQVQSQDVLPLVVLSITLLAVSLKTPVWRFPARFPKTRWLLLAGIAIACFLAYGAHSLMENFPLSIDERMVLFDMKVFDQGHLATPIAPAWRSYVETLVPAFLLKEHMPTGLVSSYLPMNALLRLGFSKFADPAFFNPLLALAGGAALLDIARRTFGRDDPACLVALLIYTLSAQMLVNAMTVYSMTAHMALNLIWLAAFLRGGRWGHFAAIVTGFVATGLHQLAFHPFFVAPFVLWRLRHGEWKLVIGYAAAYAAIILWWIYYPMLAGHEVASALQPPQNSSFISRIFRAFAERRGDTVITTFFNLLRFVAWQNLALLPLLAASVGLAVRDRGFPAVLLLGIASWLVFITIVIPFQGHGWGYRYLHPYLGSFALLAGYGYRELRNTIGRRADGFVIASSAITALATIPLLFVAAHKLIEPYLAVDRLIAEQQAPMVLIDTYPHATADGGWAGNAIEDVRNRPDLGNRPLRFSSVSMTSDMLAGLCSRGQIALITRADQRRVGFFPNASVESPKFEQLVDPVKRQMPGCFLTATGLAE
jgi:hypothetical protein